MDIVQYLVEVASCSVNVTSANGSTALLLAAMCNHAEIAQYLINRGAGLDYNRVRLVIKDRASTHMYVHYLERSLAYFQIHLF